MNLYQKTVAEIIFPLQERFKGHTTRSAYRALEQSQWLSRQQIADLQITNLRRFLLRIGETVPYYQNLFAELDFKPENVTSTADLQGLPLLDKPAIRAHGDTMKALGATDLKRFNTGGSSGEPLIFSLGKERISHDVAAKRRATRWWGVDIGDVEVVVWGSPIELNSQDRVRLLRDRLFRTELLSAFEMSQENLDLFVHRIRRRHPKMLFGYPSSLALLADHAIEHRLALDTLGIKVVFVTAERLYDHQRERIEQAFGCPVANGYGGRDAGFVAHECPQGGMHINAEDIVLEITDSDGTVLPAGESGEIVVTHLATGGFPFLRYRTGDIGVLSTDLCSCGRGLPVLASIEGRSTDFVTASNGTVLHGLALIYVLRDMSCISSFRIVQESLKHTRVQVVVASPSDRIGLAQAIRKQFRERLGQDVEISIDYVSAIPQENSGKFRYVVSKVTHQANR